MEIIENRLDIPVDEFLARPLFCFLAQCSDDGARVSPLWYLWEDDRIWIIAQLPGRSYPDRVERYPNSAIGIVEFDAEMGTVRHIGMRGEASLESFDPELATRLLRRYLGPDKTEWDEAFRGLHPDDYRLIRFDPETIVARGGTHETGLGG